MDASSCLFHVTDALDEVLDFSLLSEFIKWELLKQINYNIYPDGMKNTLNIPMQSDLILAIDRKKLKPLFIIYIIFFRHITCLENDAFSSGNVFIIPHLWSFLKRRLVARSYR